MNKRFELMMKKEQRRLVVVDIENVAGRGALTEKTAARAMRHVASACRLNNHDVVVIGASHPRNAFVAALQAPSARIVLRSGKDGADLALKNVLRHERIAERFEEVVIVSGDHAFAKEVQTLESEGVRVTVAARRGSSSHALTHSASRTLYFRRQSISAPQKKVA